jgi:hypothetical protein
MSELLERARVWIADVHPHAGHLERTLLWVERLGPDAGEAVRIAAVTHGVERAFPDGTAGWDSVSSSWRRPGCASSCSWRCP